MTASAKIVLVSGTVKARDVVGHHDYLAGCRLAAFLLAQTANVSVVMVHDGWPEDERILTGARALVFYTGGVDKHAFVHSATRIATLQRLIDEGTGLVMLHQAVRYSRAFAAQAMRWIGGVHVSPEAGRGHWPTNHRRFPTHPVTRGVQPWTIRDGWMNEIQFVDDMEGITPLVWSGSRHQGSAAGGRADVVGWTYDRPDGGRSFCFTGLDSHWAWAVPSVRQLVVNGILWSAGVNVPLAGAPCTVDETHLGSYLTPRLPKEARVLGRLWRRLRRAGT